MALWKFGHFKIVSKISQKGLETWSTDRGWWVDYLIKLKKKRHFIFPELWHFENLGIINLAVQGLQRDFWRRDVCSEWHCNHLALKFSVCVKERQDRLPTMYWLPKLHKTPYKARFIANSSSCTTTELSKLFTSCLTAVKNHVIRYCEKVYERSGKNLFWSIKNSGEVLNKLKSRGFRATSLSTYDFSTLYTTLPHNLIKEKLINLIEWTFKREGSPYIACNERQAFFTSEDTKR